jgi:[glutamine synthetase] adenylyltransferase / [glutamine synthetase]-adenylyl-L-tyrosine phosphorylase
MTVTTGDLARAGLGEAEAGLDTLARLPASLHAPVLEHLPLAADPDLALRGLARLAASGDEELVAALGAGDSTLPSGLVRVFGASYALSDFLVVTPGAWRLLGPESKQATDSAWRDHAISTLRQAREGALPVELRVPDQEPVDALRISYRSLLIQLVAADVAGTATFERVSALLSDLAVGVLGSALGIASDAVGERSGEVDLAVIAMGKCGGHELNYVSDVDVVFVAEPGGDEATKAATALATQMMRICSAHTAAGTIWPVDAALRPEGRRGALVRTMDSYRGYYERWAGTWEFQAMLKARPAAGDLTLGRKYVETFRPLVWHAADRDNFVADVQQMRARVIEHIPDDPAREIKLGPGGLRDVEFAVQLLQLVHGRTDHTLRSPNTLQALHDLSAGGYVGRDDAATLTDAYRFLRTLEHRLQLIRMRRTHVLPTDPAALRMLGRGLGYTDAPTEQLQSAWSSTSATVRRLHEKLFYRPLLAAVARIPTEGIRLSPDAAEARLEALGFLDPKAALRHLQALTEGVSRRSAIQRQLLPAMLSWFADGPAPDAGLLAFRSISDRLGATPWYLRLLRDEGVAAQRLATVLAASRYASVMLERAPDAVELLGRPQLLGVDESAVLQQMQASSARQADPEKAIAAVRTIRRRELIGVAVADVAEAAPTEQVMADLTATADASIAAGLDVAQRAVLERRGWAEAPGEMAVIAMGRFGGREMGYGSDADVIYVTTTAPGADAEEASDFFRDVATELKILLGAPMADPPLLIDADLRPEGRSGPLTRTLDSYAAYYAKWSMAWEAQALLRARPVAGNPELGKDFIDLVDPLRYPADGISRADVQYIRRIKARVDNERLPRGADRNTHTKLGRGGLADIEWTVQLLQMRHAGRLPSLRDTSTLGTLAALVDEEIVPAADAEALRSAWLLATRVRNAIMLFRGRPSDTLPTSTNELRAVARLLHLGSSGEFTEHYRRVTRHAHAVVARLFFED